MTRRVLVASGDPGVEERIRGGMESAGFSVVFETSGMHALNRARRSPLDLIVLDDPLPDRSGTEMCRLIRRRSSVPMILLKTDLDSAGIVAALEAGADACIQGNCAVEELVARMRSLLHRVPCERRADPVVRGDLLIDVTGHTVTRRGARISLTLTEFRLLLELCEQPGRVMTREALLGLVWGRRSREGSRLVDAAIRRLRGKLEDDPERPQMVQTVRGVGYRFESVAAGARDPMRHVKDSQDAAS